MHEQDDHEQQQQDPTPPLETVEVEQVTASKYVSEQDLAMYAAITGRRPVIEIVRHRSDVSVGYVASEAPKGLRSILSSARNHKKVTVWIRNMSIQARKKLDEAKLRLAS